MPADIRRDSCLRRLIRLQGPDIIKIITGIRGCGKTYLLFTQFRNYLLCSGIDESRIIEMRFDDPRNERFRDPDVFCEYLESRMRAADGRVPRPSGSHFPATQGRVLRPKVHHLDLSITTV